MVDAREVPGWVRALHAAVSAGLGDVQGRLGAVGAGALEVEAARQSAVVHAGESLDDLSRFTREVRAGRLPERPYLVVGQQSLADPTRAPAGRHTLYCYTHVPPQVDGGWAAAREGVRRSRRGAHRGAGARVSARRSSGGTSCRRPISRRGTRTCVGGDLGGGSNAWHRQLVFRPLFPYFRYRMPVKGLYLCSSYAHPGAGVHGMCGANAALIAARDVERPGVVR